MAPKRIFWHFIILHVSRFREFMRNSCQIFQTSFQTSRRKSSFHLWEVDYYTCNWNLSDIQFATIMFDFIRPKWCYSTNSCLFFDRQTTDDVTKMQRNNQKGCDRHAYWKKSTLYEVAVGTDRGCSDVVRIMRLNTTQGIVKCNATTICLLLNNS